MHYTRVQSELTALNPILWDAIPRHKMPMHENELAAHRKYVLAKNDCVAIMEARHGSEPEMSLALDARDLCTGVSAQRFCHR